MSPIWLCTNTQRVAKSLSMCLSFPHSSHVRFPKSAKMIVFVCVRSTVTQAWDPSEGLLYPGVQDALNLDSSQQLFDNFHLGHYRCGLNSGFDL